jgi:exosortase D (VPLPA-CTERM-specific)
MNLQAINSPATLFRDSTLTRASFALALGLTLLTFSEPVFRLLNTWGTQEEYSFGYLIPFISLFLIWQKSDILRQVAFTGSWQGVAVVAASLVLLGTGELGTLGMVSQYGLLLALFGLVLSYTGWQGFRVIALPFAVLIFMLPLPNFVFRELSQVLQLVSSQLGVLVIRLFGISVHLEGNVIDLGIMKMQVVEACSGLRYLFPLMTLGFIAAYFYREKFWKRALVFLSTIPVTVLMNSFRIGLIGVTVEYWGKGMAEGFLHDFEGWVIFMACTAVLIGEMWLLSRWGRPRRQLREVFGLEFPAPAPAGAPHTPRTTPRSYIAAIALIALGAIAVSAIPHREHIRPERKSFGEFPLEIEQWKGRSQFLERDILGVLKLDDYLLVNYIDGANRPVNFYVAYYASQVDGNSAHSPRDCIPGDGWAVHELATRDLSGVAFRGNSLRVNRAVIQKGQHTQLVYYWFQQRGHNLTGEYAVKLQIMQDALTRNRSDGAMVRLVTPVMDGEAIEMADQRLEMFSARAVPELAAYVPE